MLSSVFKPHLSWLAILCIVYYKKNLKKHVTITNNEVPFLTFIFCWACVLFFFCTILLYTKPATDTVHRLSSSEQEQLAFLAQGYNSEMMGSTVCVSLSFSSLSVLSDPKNYFPTYSGMAWWYCNACMVAFAWNIWLILPIRSTYCKQMWLHIPPHYDMQMTLYCSFLVSHYIHRLREIC